VPGAAGAKHREEVERFAAVLEKDGIAFSPLAYQDLLLRLVGERNQVDAGYIDYIADRYL
jgi:hypothetical protein